MSWLVGALRQPVDEITRTPSELAIANLDWRGHSFQPVKPSPMGA
jgi:hypothetical protein